MRFLLALIIVCFCGLTALAQRSDDRLRPGDTISISVFQDPKLDRQLVIGPTGMISFPLAGQIRAGGLTPAALENVLRARLRDKYTADLDISVSTVALRQLEEDLKPRIFVTGEVLRPGPFIARTRTNVLQAIALAGGFGPFAAKYRIQIHRQVNGTEVMYLFDYEAFHEGRKVDSNIDLQNGDVVVVPERGLLY